MSGAAFWDQVAETSGKQGPAHLRESEEKQRSAAKRINCPESRERKHEVYESKAHGCDERFRDAGAGLFEDRA